MINNFKILATKVKKDNKETKNILKEREQVLDTCQKEYQNMYYEDQAWKKKYAELDQEMQPRQQRFDYRRVEKKIRRPMLKKQRKRYYVGDDDSDDEDDDDNDDDDNENDADDDDFDDNNAEYIKVQKQQKKNNKEPL